MENISFEYLADDGLTKSGWTFWIHNNKLVLDGYALSCRESRRHTFRISEVWSRTNRRGNNLAAAQIPFTPLIAAHAKRALMDHIENKMQVVGPAD